AVRLKQVMMNYIDFLVGNPKSPRIESLGEPDKKNELERIAKQRASILRTLEEAYEKPQESEKILTDAAANHLPSIERRQLAKPSFSYKPSILSAFSIFGSSFSLSFLIYGLIIGF